MNETLQGVATELEVIAADTRELLGERRKASGVRHTRPVTPGTRHS
jgi:hypothetical protein